MVYKQGNLLLCWHLLIVFLSPTTAESYLPIYSHSAVPGATQNARHNLSKHPLTETSFGGFLCLPLIIPQSITPSSVRATAFYRIPLEHRHNHTHACLQDLEVLWRQEPRVLKSPRSFHSISPQLICDEQMTSPSFQGMTAGGHIPKNAFKAIYEASDDGYCTVSARTCPWGQTQTDTFLLTKYAAQPCP